MGKKSLTVNTKGLAKNLKHGTDHNSTTTKIEAVDKKIKKVQGFVKGSQKKINEFDEDNKTLLDVWKNFKK